MPIDVTLLVRTSPPAATPLEVRLPGGVSLAAMPQLPVPNAATMTRTMIGQLNAALAPLAPALRLVDFAISAFETIKSVPAAFVDPSELIENIEKLARNAGALAGFVPALGVPRLAADLVDLLIAYLDGLVAELRAIQEVQAKIAAATAQAATYPQLTIVIDASSADLAIHVDALNTGLGPAGTLIRLANLILGMAGISALSDLPGIGDDVQASIDALQSAAMTLRTVRQTLPV